MAGSTASVEGNRRRTLFDPVDLTELWKVEGAEHAAALGAAPQEYETRVVQFFKKYPGGK